MNPKKSQRSDWIAMKQAFLFSASILFLIWVIWFSQFIFAWDLLQLGVYPRRIDGLLGILSSPLVHIGFAHLSANSLPLLVMTTILLYAYPRASKWFLPTLYLGSGFGVWLFGREAFHIGASGLTHGLMYFLFLIGVLRRDRLSIAVALIVFFLYGGMVWGVLPSSPEVSFESHLSGALVGLLMAMLLRNLDQRGGGVKSDAVDSDSEDLIGDEWKLPGQRE